MFETQDFRNQLTNAISTEAAENRMGRYQTAIVDLLFDYARNNEADLMPIEFTKALPQRRGVANALESARTLVRDASLIARNDNRDLLTRADIEVAYRAKYCRVWPFCK